VRKKILAGLGVSFILMTALASAQVTRGPIMRGVASGLKYVLGTSITEASDGVLTLLNNAGTSFSLLQLGGTTSGFPSLKRNGVNLESRLADDSARTGFLAGTLNASAYVSATSSALLMSSTAPTISSGFGTSPSIASNNGTASFRVNVGTGGAATSGVVGLATASNGWNCQVIDMTNNTVTRETASTTTSVTVTAAAAWAASDILIFNCFGY
jgi:hypothetical protein